MKRLIETDSKRIAAVMNELIVDLQSLAAIPNQAFDFTTADTSLGDSSLNQQLRHHLTLEEEFLELTSTHALTKGDLQNRVKGLRTSCVNLCHALSGDSLAAGAQQSVAPPPPPVNSILPPSAKISRSALTTPASTGSNQPVSGLRPFTNVMRDAKFLFESKLASTVEEDHSQEDFLSDSMARKKKLDSDAAALNTQFSSERQIREVTISALDKDLAILQDDMQGRSQQVSREVNERIVSLKHREAMAQATFAQKEAFLSTRVSELAENLTRMISNQEKKEKELRDKCKQLDSRVREWIEEYDKTMAHKHSELDALNDEISQGQTEEAEIQKQFDELNEKIRKRIQEKEEKRLKEEREKEMRIHKAAVKIQSLWKAHVARKMFKALKAAKPGKKLTKPGTARSSKSASPTKARR